MHSPVLSNSKVLWLSSVTESQHRNSFESSLSSTSSFVSKESTLTPEIHPATLWTTDAATNSVHRSHVEHVLLLRLEHLAAKLTDENLKQQRKYTSLPVLSFIFIFKKNYELRAKKSMERDQIKRSGERSFAQVQVFIELFSRVEVTSATNQADDRTTDAVITLQMEHESRTVSLENLLADGTSVDLQRETAQLQQRGKQQENSNGLIYLSISDLLKLIAIAFLLLQFTRILTRKTHNANFEVRSEKKKSENISTQISHSTANEPVRFLALAVPCIVDQRWHVLHVHLLQHNLVLLC